MANEDFIRFGQLVQDVVPSAGTDADQRHREVRSKLYRQKANSEMEETPLTKMIMSNPGSPVVNPKYEWGMDARDDRYVKVTGAFTDSGLGTAVTADAQTADGDVVYLKMDETAAKQFVKHEEVQLRLHNTTDDSDPDHEATLQVVVIDRSTINAANSYLQVKLLEDDKGSGILNSNVLGRAFNGTNAANCVCYATPISPAMPEGSMLPWSRYREATMHYNYCQIFMAGLAITGTEASNETIFNENTYNRYWRQLDNQFDTYVERAAIWGSRQYIPDYTVDMGNGSQEVELYRSGGIVWALKNLAGGKNVINIRQTGQFMDYDFSGVSWEEGAYDFLNLLMLRLSKKSGKTKKMFCSDEAKLSIVNMFQTMTNIQVDSKFKDDFGFDVTKIWGLNCSLELHQHADFSCNPSLKRTALIVEPGKIGWRSKKGRDKTVIRSVKDIPKNVEDGFGFRDAKKEGIMMDGGFIFDDLDGMALLTGLGRDFKSN